MSPDPRPAQTTISARRSKQGAGLDPRLLVRLVGDLPYVAGLSLDLLGFLASLYREKKDDTSALEVLRHTVELDPKNDKLWFALGAVYDENKRKEEEKHKK